MNKILELTEKYLLYAIVFLIPLVVLPVFPNAYVTGKLLVLTFGVGALFIVKTLKTFVRGSVSFNAGSFDFPIILLAGAYLASAILNTPNKMDAYFLPGTASVMIAGALLYFILNQFDEKAKKFTAVSLYLSAVVIALIALLSSAGVLSSISALPPFVRTGTFSPLGGFLQSLIYLAVFVPVGINMIMKEKDVSKKAFWGVSLALILFGLTLSLFNLLPGKPSSPQLPSHNTSWMVAVDSLKVSPLLGIGPGNYVTAFNRFRPLSYNYTDLWRLRFTSARSFYMTVITESGLVGLSAIMILGYSVFQYAKNENFGKGAKEKKLVGWSSKNNTFMAPLIVLIVMLALFPANIVFISLLFILLALNTETNKVDLGSYVGAQSEEKSFEMQFAAKLPVIVLTLPVYIVAGYLIYKASSVIQAEYVYNKALQAVVANDGRSAYELMQKSISINPMVDRYHTTYSQINLGIADSLARQEEISEEDRNTIAQLIQQAIREGKSTVTLNPQRASNWEVLARIYQSVIPLAENADVFAVQTFNQAINLDPINPELRVAMGGIYYAAGNYDAAQNAFELAVQAKSDFANSRYNLAFAYREKGLIDAAIQQMTAVISLVDRDSADYETAKQVLEELQSKKAELSTENGENLTAPTQNENVIEPKVELPADAQPPSPEPTATPEPSPEASPTPLP